MIMFGKDSDSKLCWQTLTGTGPGPGPAQAPAPAPRQGPGMEWERNITITE